MKWLHLGWFAWLCAACTPSNTSVLSYTPSAVPVVVGEAQAPVLDDRWALVGQVRSLRNATVAARAPGELRDLELAEGDLVKEGERIASVDDGLVRARMDTLRAEIKVLQAEQSAAQGEAKRLGALSDVPTMAAKAAAARSRATVLKAKVAAAKVRLEEWGVEQVAPEVRAPFTGVLTAVHRSTGDYVYAGDPVVDLVSVGSVEVVVDGPARLIQELEVGSSVTVEGPNVVLADVVAVVPAVDPHTGWARARFKPSEPRPWLVDGAIVQVRLPVEEADGTVMVPKSALVRGPRGEQIVRVQDARAVRVDVRTLGQAGDLRLVLGADLRPSDPIIVDGASALRSGQLVVATNQAAAPTP